jgi:hypothetical protein
VKDLTRCRHNKSSLVTKTGLFDIPVDSSFVNAQGVRVALELIYINCKQRWNNRIYELASSLTKEIAYYSRHSLLSIV